MCLFTCNMSHLHFRMSKRFKSDLLDNVDSNSQSEGEHQILELEIKKPIISLNMDSDGG